METSLIKQDWQPPQMMLFPFPPQTLDEIVFDADNPAGIPQLDISMQATEIVEPFLIWGSIARTKYMPGIYNQNISILLTNLPKQKQKIYIGC